VCLSFSNIQKYYEKGNLELTRYISHPTLLFISFPPSLFFLFVEKTKKKKIKTIKNKKRKKFKKIDKIFKI